MANPPHILMIIADDFGWANLGLHRRATTNASSATELQAKVEAYTPNLDTLADEGIHLTRHCAYPWLEDTALPMSRTRCLLIT
jgi:arylsulfatase B